MLTIPPTGFRKRRGRTKARKTTPPTVLTLVSASYVEGTSITLTFDREINVAGLVGSAILVNDPSNGSQFAATGSVTVIDPTTVEIGLVFVQDWSAGDISLNATAGTGIVAVDDGGTWAGVTDLALPFP